MDENIKNKVIVITGASSGMGEAAARYLGANGARVILAARRKDRIEQISQEIILNGGEAIAIEADVTNLKDMETLADITINKWDRIDVLINNAGVMPLSLLEQCKVNEWNQMIDVNLRGVLHGIAAILPYMKKQKQGHIINTASIAAHTVFPTSSVYSATKFAVRAITEGLRQELKEYNIRTTLICPGAVSTELLDHITEDEIKKSNQTYVNEVGIPPSSYARMVAFAINEPNDVDVNEIIFRPTAQTL